MDNIFGVRIDRYSENQLLEIIKKSVDTSKKLQVVTLNTELLVASKTDKKLQGVLNQAGLVVPESSGLQIANHFYASKAKNKLLRLLGSGWKVMTGSKINPNERLAGVDLCYATAGLCQEFGYKLLLLGGGAEVAFQAATNLKKLYPKLKVVGVYGGLVGRDDQLIAAQVQRERPDVLFVAFGQPTQEYWIAENLNKISAKVAVGVGGSLDFMAGKVPRAPKLVRNLGLEWAFRLVAQPWRVKRQFALVKFIRYLWQQR